MPDNLNQYLPIMSVSQQVKDLYTSGYNYMCFQTSGVQESAQFYSQTYKYVIFQTPSWNSGELYITQARQINFSVSIDKDTGAVAYSGINPIGGVIEFTTAQLEYFAGIFTGIYLATYDASIMVFCNFELSPIVITTSNKDGISGGGFEPDPGTDPDAGGGNQDWGQGSPITSTTGGTFDNTSDTVSGGYSQSVKGGPIFNNYYALFPGQVESLKNVIWGVTLPWSTKPSEAILSLMLFPFALNNVSNITSVVEINIGNTSKALPINGVATNTWEMNKRYDNEINFGDITLEPYFNGFQDYAPHTKIKIWLPFIGYRDIDPVYVQGKTLNVKYHISYTDGSCVVVLSSNGVIFNRLNGQVGYSIPLNQVDNKMIEATMSGTLQAAGVVAASAINPVLGVGLAASALSTVSNSKPSISGSTGSGGEFEGSLPMECFLVIERPECAIAQTYNSEKGRPSLVSKQLSKCKGFTSMVDPKVNALCTSTENDKINTLLKQGVIING